MRMRELIGAVCAFVGLIATGSGTRAQEALLEFQELSGLRGGLNLISFQVLPDDRSVEGVFAALEPGGLKRLFAVWTYDAERATWLVWRAADEDGAELNDIPGVGVPALELNRGYWIELAPGSYGLRVTGKPPADGRIVFHPGWNLLGFDAPPIQEIKIADIEAVFGEHIDFRNPERSKIDFLYVVNSQGDFEKYDITNDRPTGDLGGGFLPPGNEGPGADRDDFQHLFAGTGYWVHVRQRFALRPLLKTVIQGDADVSPVGNFRAGAPGPEDLDIDRDQRIDLGVWVATVDANGNVQSPVDDTDQSTLRFFPSLHRHDLIIRNDGTGILRYRAIWRGDPWLTVANGNGLIVGAPATVSLVANRDGLLGGAEHIGEIVVETTGGRRVFAVRLDVADLVGDFRGRARIASVNGNLVDLPSVDLQLSLFRATDVSIRGLIDAESTLTFPVDVPLSGANYIAGSNQFALVGSYRLDPGKPTYDPDDLNPFTCELRREVTLIGDRPTNERLEGVYVETITGLTPQPLRLEGTFALDRQGIVPTKREGAVGEWTPGAQPGRIIDQQTLERYIDINDRILIEKLEVEVDITHPRVSDLEVWLLGPDPDAAGPQAPLRQVRLHNRTDGQDLKVTYPLDRFADNPPNPTAFDVFRNLISAGRWTLRVLDNVDGPPGGTQTVRSWNLRIHGPKVFRVRGMVLDGSDGNRQLAGAVVSLTGGTSVPSAVTGADGIYEFDLLTRHFYQLSASRIGYVGVERRFYLDADRLSENVVLRLPTSQEQPQSELLITNRLGYSPFTTTLRYISSTLRPGRLYTFIVTKVDPQNPAQILGEPIVKSVFTPEATFDGLTSGVYDARVSPDGEQSIVVPQAIVVYPNPAVEDVQQQFLLAGYVFSGGGCVPGTYPFNDPVPGTISVQEYMIDATTFDNDRPPVDPQTFPGLEDTDTRIVGLIPQGPYALVPGDVGYDAPVVPEPQDQTWRNFRITANVGGVWFSGVGIGNNGAGGRARDLHLVVGPRTFPIDWAPSGDVK